MRMGLVFVGLGVVLAAGLGGIYAYHVHTKDVARRKLEATATALSDCLVGDATGDAGEALKHVALGAHASYTPDDSATAWPKRCETYLPALREAHRTAYSLGVVRTLPDFDGALNWFDLAMLDKLADLLRGFDELRTKGAHDVTVPKPPPALAPAIAMSSLAPTIKGSDLSAGPRSVTDHGVRFELSAEGHVYGCEYGATSKKATCVAAPIGADRTLEGDIGAPFAFVRSASDGMDVVDEKGGVLLGGQMPLVGFTRTDGSLALLESTSTFESFGARVSERSAKGVVTRAPWDESVIGATPRSAAGFVTWKDTPTRYGEGTFGGTGGPAATIVAREVKVASKPTRVGSVGRRAANEIHTDGTCAAASTFFDMSPALVVRDAGGAWWSRPEKALASDKGDAERTMSCSGDHADILDHEGNDLTWQRCTATGCTKETVTVTLPEGTKALVSGDRVFAFWRDERVGATYYVRSKLADLATAKPAVLVDAAFSGAKIGLTGVYFGGDDVFAFGDQVLLIARPGPYLIAIDGDGHAHNPAFGK